MNKKAFTILEMLLVVAILAITASAAIFSLTNFIQATQLDNKRDEVIQVLRKAQSNATMRVKDSQWGVYFDVKNQEFTFFKGSSYGVDTTYDQTYTFPGNVLLQNISLNGGGDEVIFKKVTGETDHYGSLEIVDATPAKYTITINSLGQIEVD